MARVTAPPPAEQPPTPFQALGEEGIAALVAAFYRRVPDDPILGPMYPEDDLPGAEERLREFLIYRFGGPPRYIETRGHPRLRMRHAPFSVDRAARDRWVELMEAAIAETPMPPGLDEALRGFFGDVATFLINRA